MNTKNKKENQPKATIQRKQGKNVKEFVPSSKNSVREMNYFKQPTEMNRIFKADFEPIELFPEWPTDEEIKVKLNLQIIILFYNKLNNIIYFELFCL